MLHLRYLVGNCFGWPGAFGCCMHDCITDGLPAVVVRGFFENCWVCSSGWLVGLFCVVVLDFGGCMSAGRVERASTSSW